MLYDQWAWPWLGREEALGSEWSGPALGLMSPLPLVVLCPLAGDSYLFPVTIMGADPALQGGLSHPDETGDHVVEGSPDVCVWCLSNLPSESSLSGTHGVESVQGKVEDHF